LHTGVFSVVGCDRLSDILASVQQLSPHPPSAAAPSAIAEGQPHAAHVLWSPSKRRYQFWGAIMLIAVAMLTTLPGRSLRTQIARVRFFASCAREIKHISELTRPSTSDNLKRTLQERPSLVGMAAWPYINSVWSAGQRFDAVQVHYDELRRFDSLQIGTHDQLQVSDLSDIVPGLKVVIDRPNWFMREGELTINLFKDDFRAYSLAFTFGRIGAERVLYVGCIQGRQADGVEQLYRDLTKKLHGWRPRDVMVSLIQMVAAASDVSRVRLVSESARVHRHKYFGAAHEQLVSANYDEIWREHDAVPGEGDFFDLAPQLRRRAPEEIASHKRAMYRRRYELMDRLQADVNASMRGRAVAEWPAAATLQAPTIVA
jgi:uncharacterized protein VirK/YbjX